MSKYGSISLSDAAQIYSKLASLSEGAAYVLPPNPVPFDAKAAQSEFEANFSSLEELSQVFAARLGEVLSMEKSVKSKLAAFGALDRGLMESRREKLQLQSELEQMRGPEAPRGGTLAVLQAKCRDLSATNKQMEDGNAAELVALRQKTEKFLINSVIHGEAGGEGGDSGQLSIIKTLEGMEKANEVGEREVAEQKDKLLKLEQLVFEKKSYAESAAKQRELQASMAAAIRAQRTHQKDQNEAQVQRMETLIHDFTRRAAERREYNKNKWQELTKHRATIQDSRSLHSKLEEQNRVREKLVASHRELNNTLRAQSTAKDVELITGISTKERLLVAIQEQEAENDDKAKSCKMIQEKLRLGRGRAELGLARATGAGGVAGGVSSSCGSSSSGSGGAGL